MNLYTSAVIAGAGRVANTPDAQAAEMATVAAEMIFAATLALNAVSPQSKLSALPYEMTYPTPTPYRHLTLALEGVLREIFTAQGFDVADASTLTDRTGTVMHDLIGESDPVRRAIGYVRDELIDAAHSDAIDYWECFVHCRACGGPCEATYGH